MADGPIYVSTPPTVNLVIGAPAVALDGVRGFWAGTRTAYDALPPERRDVVGVVYFISD